MESNLIQSQTETDNSSYLCRMTGLNNLKPTVNPEKLVKYLMEKSLQSFKGNIILRFNGKGGIINIREETVVNVDMESEGEDAVDNVKEMIKWKVSGKQAISYMHGKVTKIINCRSLKLNRFF